MQIITTALKTFYRALPPALSFTEVIPFHLYFLYIVKVRLVSEIDEWTPDQFISSKNFDTYELALVRIHIIHPLEGAPRRAIVVPHYC